jgi:Ca2+-binding RTX toxin-like protein
MTRWCWRTPGTRSRSCIDVASYPSGLAGYRQQIDPDIENIRLEGATGHDVVADGGANVIAGDAGDNRLYGAGGDDALFGNAGDDLLDGGAGDDWLDGGEGADELYTRRPITSSITRAATACVSTAPTPRSSASRPWARISS